jgi:hypothetical protein
MATIQVRGRVKDGTIELSDPVDLPDGTEVLVSLELPAELPPHVRDFLHLPAIGMWQDREEMADPVEWLRKTREEQWQRRINPD